ncbi:MAG: hypothetical protein GC199_06590 [Alphaproteobacteria bacterium]|nr:hypothetical protein [Alphaproteobacteria bacterium]
MSEWERSGAAEETERRGHLMKAETQIAWLRWIGMVGWLYIIVSAEEPRPLSVWGVYLAGVAYTLFAHWGAAGEKRIAWSARVTTIGDPLLVTAICLLTGGVGSIFFPFYYFTLLAAAFRYGVREAGAVLAFNAALATILYIAVPDARASALAVGLFYLVFSALLGALLANWAQENLALAHRRAEALRVAGDRTRTLLQRLISSQEDERKRVAGEIHDSMSGHLFALRHSLDAIRERAGSLGALEPTLQRLDCAVRETSQEVRRLMNELRPTVLDDLGLAPAVEEYVAELRGTVPFAIDLAIEADARPVGGDGEAALFRILQEAILNIRKHANASRVSIRIAGRDVAGVRHVALDVIDDGKGFDPAQPRAGHFGILTMRERAEAVGGRLEIDAAAENGTRITALVPLDR